MWIPHDLLKRILSKFICGHSVVMSAAVTTDEFVTGSFSSLPKPLDVGIWVTGVRGPDSGPQGGLISLGFLLISYLLSTLFWGFVCW